MITVASILLLLMVSTLYVGLPFNLIITLIYGYNALKRVVKWESQRSDRTSIHPFQNHASEDDSNESKD